MRITTPLSVTLQSVPSKLQLGYFGYLVLTIEFSVCGFCLKACLFTQLTFLGGNTLEDSIARSAPSSQI